MPRVALQPLCFKKAPPALDGQLHRHPRDVGRACAAGPGPPGFPRPKSCCRSDAGGDCIGGLWGLEVPERARAETLIEQDPYLLAGARHYELRTWGKAFEPHRVVR